MNEANLEETFINFYGCYFPFLGIQANFLLGNEVRTMIIVLVTTKEKKSLSTDFNQDNWPDVRNLANV